MKYAILSVVTGATLALAMPAAYASDGTLTFSGKLNASTCKVTVDGSHASPQITLPTVATPTLQTAGATSTPQAFTFRLSGCDYDEKNKLTVSTFFESGPGVDVANGLLNNTAPEASAAKNIKLAIIDPATNRDIKIGDPSQAANNPSVEVQADGSAALPFGVAYRSTGEASAGDVQASVTYSIIYK